MLSFSLATNALFYTDDIARQAPCPVVAERGAAPEAQDHDAGPAGTRGGRGPRVSLGGAGSLPGPAGVYGGLTCV